MKRTLIRTFAVAALVLCCTMPARSQSIDIAKCQSLVETCREKSPTRSQVAFMVSQCRIVADIFLKETGRIKKMPTVEARKEAADKSNRTYAREYDVYALMLRILNRAARNENIPLGRLNEAEIEHLVSDNKYINRMFTIFRSRYSLND